MDRIVKPFPSHNVPGNLPIPTQEKHRIFKSMVIGLRSSPIFKAISATPVICQGMMVDFWKNATVDSDGDNRRGIIKSKIREHPVEITVQMIRDVLGFGDQNTYPTSFSKEEIRPVLERMSCEGLIVKFPPANKGLLPPYWRLLAHVYICCVSPRNTKTDDMTQDISAAVAALVMGWNFNFSQMVLDAMKLNTEKASPNMLYPRFLQMIFDERYPHIPKTADILDQKPLGDHTFKGIASTTKYQGLRPLEKFGRFLETEGVQVQEPVIERDPEVEIAAQVIPEETDINNPEVQHVEPPPLVPPVVHEIDSEDDEEEDTSVAQEVGAGMVDLVKVEEELDTFVPSVQIDKSILGVRIGQDGSRAVNVGDDDQMPIQEADLIL